MIRLPFHVLRRHNSTASAALVDSFDRRHSYLRMSLTERCNLRCTYCMPLNGVELSSPEKLMSFEEQKRAITIFSTLGMTKIRFTGGEPTLNKNLPELIRHARLDSGVQSAGITTNGETR
jgi:molybdenum cofactor biosynthesis enzyme MoaA